MLVQFDNLVAAADAEAVNENIGHSATASLFKQQILQRATDGVLVEFDYVRLGFNRIFVEKDALCALGVRAVALGKDDNYIN